MFLRFAKSFNPQGFCPGSGRGCSGVLGAELRARGGGVPPRTTIPPERKTAKVSRRGKIDFLIFSLGTKGHLADVKITDAGVFHSFTILVLMMLVPSVSNINATRNLLVTSFWHF